MKSTIARSDVETIRLDDDRPPRKPVPWIRIAAAVAAVAAAVFFGAHWLLVDRFRVRTDDAYIDTDQVMVMSRVSERVAAVLVDANQRVRRGQPVVQLEDATERARLALAQENRRSLEASAVAAHHAASLERELQAAQVRSQTGGISAAREGSAVSAAQAAAASKAIEVAQAELDAARAQVRVADAAVPAARNALQKAQNDRRRLYALGRDGYVSASAMEAADTAVAQARSTADAAAAQAASARVNVLTADAKVMQARAAALAARSAAGASRAQIPIAQGKLDESAAPSRVSDKESEAAAARANAAATEAQVRLAQLDLDATRVTAPVDGWVSARNVEAGQTVAPGQALLTISPAGRIFVTANYKETQLSRIRTGAPVEISVDACRGQTFRGLVLGLGPVAQSALATLPTLTAPSNFVKVAQRVPVRIGLPKDGGACVFRPGMSVETAVLTK